MFIKIVLVILALIIIILFSNIRLTIKLNQSNAKFNGFVSIRVLGVFKITKKFDETTLKNRNKKDDPNKNKNVIVEWFGKENAKFDYGKIEILFNSLLDIFKIIGDKVAIYDLELSADYCLDDAAATSVSYGLFSGVLGIFTAFIENKQLIKRKFSVKIMPHFCNNSFLNTSLFCIFNVKLGNIIITGIRIFMYLNRIKKKLKES